MRDPFPYESNVLLLSNYLVPEPISRSEWEDGLEEWNRSEREMSFLEFLVRSRKVTEQAFLCWMEQALGMEVDLTGTEIASPGSNPEREMLRQNGFLILEPVQGRKRLCGGPDLPPMLEKFLGEQAREWQWVLKSPLRDQGDIGRIKKPEEIPFDSVVSQTGHWLDQLLQTCRAKKVSDLHLEKIGEDLSIRMRTGGNMQQIGCWNGPRAASAIRLLKEWSGIPTSENSLPADGRLSREIDRAKHTFRVSHLRTVQGESLVLRQLGSGASIRSLEELHVPVELIREMRKSIQWNPGLILFTGPTGSGKTTTLYGLLSGLWDSSQKILTIEDPIEYELPHATQCSVDERNGWTFDRAIRAFLRQDPDIIVLGEMRDKASAEAACRAALTGHCVLATLHARSTSAAIARLHAWGIPDGITTEVIRLVINQRLQKVLNAESLSASFTWKEPV